MKYFIGLIPSGHPEYYSLHNPILLVIIIVNLIHGKKVQWFTTKNYIKIAAVYVMKWDNLKWNEMKYILFSKIYINILQFQVIAERKTQGNLWTTKHSW